MVRGGNISATTPYFVRLILMTETIPGSFLMKGPDQQNLHMGVSGWLTRSSLLKFVNLLKSLNCKVYGKPAEGPEKNNKHD